MAFITWNENYSVNIKAIDAQHKKLFDIINNLHTAMREGKAKEIMDNIFSDLIEYTRTHFSNEERLMNGNSYPEYPQHKPKHDDLIKQVLDLQKQFQGGTIAISIKVMNFLQDWLTNHILQIDKKYSSFLNSKGVV